MIAIKDLYNFSKNINTALLGNLSDFDFMQMYKDNFKKYDLSFKMLFSDKVFSNDKITIETAFELWKEEVEAVILLNLEKYNRYFQMLNSEYNPIENYDRTENITVTRKGVVENRESALTRKGTVEDRTGGIKDTINYSGKEKNNNSYIFGETKGNTTIGSSPYDMADFKDVSKNEAIRESYTNTESMEKSFEARKDENVKEFVNFKNAVDNTETETNKNEVDNVETTTSKIHGNIGITTATQMMAENVTFWDMFNFYKIIFVDIVETICLKYWNNSIELEL